MVKYAHAIQPGDQVWARGEWALVVDKWPLPGDGIYMDFAGTFPRLRYEAMEPLSVIPGEAS